MNTLTYTTAAPSTEIEGVIGSQAMVATGHPLAAAAAADTLRAGGSAVDAAIAADAVMGVVEPMATSIGGDLLAMVVPAAAAPVSYNGTGRSPSALTASLVQRLPQARIPERHPLSVTVPGVVRGWHDLHCRFGRLPWARLFDAAICTADTGFAVAPVAAREWKLFEGVLRQDPACAQLFRASSVPQAGDQFANPDLARTLQAIATDGPDAYYLGAPAQQATRAVQSMGGVLAAEDFATHTGHFCAPLSADFRGISVLQCPPNTHGVAVLHALQALESHALPPDDPHSYVVMVEAMRAAMRHARKIVADPAAPGNTVCTVVVDRDGLGVSLMSSVFKRFGSGIAVPGSGFVLQNRGFGFAAPGHVNGAGPSRRPYHTVVPGAALRNGRLHAVMGVVGGAMQPQGQVQILVRTAAWGQPLQAALDAPRWRLESDTGLAIESGMHHAIRDALRGAGFVDPSGQGELGGRSDFGGAQMVMRRHDGALVGGSDARKDGCALAVDGPTA